MAVFNAVMYSVLEKVVQRLALLGSFVDCFFSTSIRTCYDSLGRNTRIARVGSSRGVSNACLRMGE